jgi:TRAP-type C4-dicarboxylate transport system permease small subunit
MNLAEKVNCFDSLSAENNEGGMDFVKCFKMLDSLLMLLVKPLAIILGLFVAFSMTLGIFCRIVLGTPMFGLEEVILIAVMWLYMFGAILASKERSHLAADFVQVVVKNKKMVSFMRLLASVISLVIGICISTWCYDLMVWAFVKKQATPVFNIPWYYSQSSLFIASLFFIFYMLRDIAVDLHEWLKE